MKRMRLFPFVYALQGALMGGFYAIWQPRILERGLSLKELSILLSLQTIISLLVDIPTGALADRIGSRRVTLIGYAFYASAFLFPSLHSSPYVLALGILFIGFGDCFVNGALDAWLNSLQDKDNHKESYFTRDRWVISGRVSGALALPGILSITHASLTSTWILYFAVGVLLLALAALLPHDVNTSKSSVTSEASRPLFKLLHAGLIHPIQIFLNDSQGPALLFLSLLFGITEGTTAFAFRPRLMELGIQSTFAFGLIQAALGLSRLFGLYLYRKTHLIHSPHIIIIALITAGVFALGFPTLSVFPLAISFWLLRIITLSAYFPSVKAAFTATEVGTKLPATAISVQSVATDVGCLVFTLSVGFLPAAYISTRSILVLGAVCTIGAGLGWVKLLHSRTMSRSYHP